MKGSRLLASLLALALAAPALGADEPGVFKVPGTDSTIKFYGYVQLDTTLDFSGRPVGYENSDWATILPAVPADDSPEGKRLKPQLYFTARTSRFGLQTTTPTGVGNVVVKLEGDFNAPNGFQSETFTNSVGFRLRQAYGTLGGFLAGQTWTTFLDLGAYPDVVDFNGPGTIALVRNPMLRYTLGLAPGAKLAISAENTRGPQFGVDARYQTIPDIHANLTYGAGWGHVSIRGVMQTYNRAAVGTAGIPPADVYLDQSPESTQSFAGAISGSLKLGGDTLVAQFAGGPGIGRYMLNALAVPFVSAKANGDLELWTVWGAHVGFTHVWAKGLRSNLVGAYTWVDDPKIDGVATPNQVGGTPFEKTLIQGFVNTFWSFAKNAEVGVEYAYGQWKSFTGGGTPELEGTQNRVNASVHFNFM